MPVPTSRPIVESAVVDQVASVEHPEHDRIDGRHSAATCVGDRRVALRRACRHASGLTFAMARIEADWEQADLDPRRAPGLLPDPRT